MVCGRVCAVEQPLALQKAFQLSAAVQDSQTLRVRWNIAKNYYLYRDRINFRVRNQFLFNIDILYKTCY